MQVYAVRYETRNLLGHIVQEIDSLWVDWESACARKREINSDPVTYPNMVAWTVQYTISIRKQRSSKKLDAEAVIEIRQRSELGESPRSMAPDYGVSHQSVRDVINRKSWTHV